MPKIEKDLLWVEVAKDSVTLRSGPQMPAPNEGYPFFTFGGNHISRKEFARWSGVKFPKGVGIYALRLKLGILRRYRKVSSEEFVAAKHRTVTLEQVHADD